MPDGITVEIPNFPIYIRFLPEVPQKLIFSARCLWVSGCYNLLKYRMANKDYQLHKLKIETQLFRKVSIVSFINQCVLP